jgi:predicted double-glycine peptidase
MKIYAIPALLIGILAFTLFRLAYIRYSTTGARAGLILTGILLATPAVMFASNYVLLIPCASWFCDWHALPGIESISGLIGALLGIMFASSKLRPGRLNTPILIACVMMALGLLIAPFAKQLCYGVDYSTLEDKWKSGICLQTSSYTCVSACVATLIRMQGGHITEPELARSAGATVTGTEFWYLKRALRKRGYEPQFRNIRSAREAPIPSIVGVTVTGINHVVVLLDKDAEGVTIGEPLRGRREYSWSVFRKCYRPDGTCITIRRLQDTDRHLPLEN